MATEVGGLISLYRLRLLPEGRVGTFIRNSPSAGAFDAGRMVGFVYSSRFDPNTLEIEDLFVERYWKDKGVGSLLLQSLESQALQEGCHSIAAMTGVRAGSKGHLAADICFYEAQGFSADESTSKTTKRMIKRIYQA